MLWPPIGENEQPAVSTGFVESTWLIPSQPVSYSFALTVPGIYNLQYPSDGLEIELKNTSTGESIALDADLSGSLNEYTPTLVPEHTCSHF